MAFEWTTHPEADDFIRQRVDAAFAASSLLGRLTTRFRDEAGVRLQDFVDHLSVLLDGETEATLSKLGFVRDERVDGAAFVHPGTCLPRVVPAARAGVALAAESVGHFLAVHGLDGTIEGAPLGRYRRAVIGDDGAVDVTVVERRTAAALAPLDEPNDGPARWFAALEAWQRRRRDGDDDEVMAAAIELARRQVAGFGETLATITFFVNEVAYWRSRNRAGQEVKAMLDTVGVGCAAQDHYAFRSSRRNFGRLLRFFMILGFRPREKFHAGAEAGWGAQVVEHPDVGLALFLDLDLSPEELDLDFTTAELPPRNELGTVGLWCALHGDSLCRAGTHHMAQRSSFDDLPGLLKKRRITTMAPLSDFDHLHQAFTKGQRWTVDEARIDALRAAELISDDDAATFRTTGAVGSHLEIIQRGQGFKGFSQRHVSAIMRATDPRTA